MCVHIIVVCGIGHLALVRLCHVEQQIPLFPYLPVIVVEGNIVDLIGRYSAIILAQMGDNITWPFLLEIEYSIRFSSKPDIPFTLRTLVYAVDSYAE